VTLRAATIGASLAGLPFMLPHVVEDFAAGTVPIGAALLGGFLAVQMLGLVLVGSGWRLGWAITCVAGLVWVVGAAADHGPALARGSFRSGGLSVVWVLGLIVSQATAAVLAYQGWRRSRLDS
jgi:hypothetical protein